MDGTVAALGGVALWHAAHHARRRLVARRWRRKDRSPTRNRQEVERLRARYKADRRAYYATSHWQALRKQVWARDVNAEGVPACRTCWRTSAQVQLDVHHRTYERIGEERLEDLVLLDSDCHKAIHTHVWQVLRRERERSGVLRVRPEGVAHLDGVSGNGLHVHQHRTFRTAGDGRDPEDGHAVS